MNALDEELFVGRGRELDFFRVWLRAAPRRPEILNVHGPGGVGKTALLRACVRAARDTGHRVVFVDARAFVATPRGLRVALGGGSLDAVVARLNCAAPVLVLDTYEEMVGLDCFLRDRLLAQLDVVVRVVIASRQPLSRQWEKEDLWHKLVRPLPLGGLPPAEARLYLERRGLGDQPWVLQQILRATRGHPLGLLLAADLALRLRLSSLEAAPEWHLVVHSLVERLHETTDPGLRELLETAAILRQFDEATLVGVAGRPVDPTAFAQVCSLSVVEPTPHGLALHDDVRHILAEDLRWRDPKRHAALCQRAAAYYRDRAAQADPSERARLVCDRLFLSDRQSLRHALFGEVRADEIHVDRGRQADHAAVGAMWAQAYRVDGSFVDDFLNFPGTRMQVARDPHEKVLGFATAVPVSMESLRLLERQVDLDEVLRAYIGQATESLPLTGEASSIVCHTLVAEGLSATSTIAALLRDALEVLLLRGVHLIRSPLAELQEALEILGFEPIADAADDGRGAATQMRGYVLDLIRSGVEPWIDAVAAGRRPPKRLAPADLERELRAVLPRWSDDACLRRSSLWEAGVLRRRQLAVAPQVYGNASRLN